MSDTPSKRRRALRRAHPMLWLSTLLLMNHAAAAPVSDTLAQRGSACTACHGKDGRATAIGFYPRIAGKPAGYLYNQLVNFQSGRRTNGNMRWVLRNLSDEYLREIAEYFGGIELPYPVPRASTSTEQELQRGRTLAMVGDLELGLPACVACHGRTLTGTTPAVPGLLGLPPDYLNSQLGAWKNGQRHAAAPDCMATVASKLTAQDISALTGWLASQPVRDQGRPASKFDAPLPIRCGSVAP